MDVISNSVVLEKESEKFDLENQKISTVGCCCGCKKTGNQLSACICKDCKCHLRKRMESHEKKGLEKELKYLGGSILCTTLILFGIYGSRFL